MSSESSSFAFGLGLVVGGGALIGSLFFVGPWYGVYSQGMAGKARLTEAESSRQIAVLEAQAKRQAAEELAQADIIRAKGSAQAVEELGKQLEQNPAYIQYLYVQSLGENGEPGDRTVIYVPTENGVPLPITEANRLQSALKAPEIPTR